MRSLYGILVLLLATGISAHSYGFRVPLREDDVDAEIFANEILQFAETGYRSDLFAVYINALTLPKKLQNVDARSIAGPSSVAVCKICKSVAKTIISMRQNGFSMERIQEIIINICTSLNIQKEHVCRGVVRTQLPIILYITDIDPSIDPVEFCGLALQSECSSPINKKYEWTIEIDNNPPRKIPPLEVEGTFKIVQLTDIHYDPYYEPNENSHCEEPMCCRKGQNVTNTSGKVAGYWGDYHDCDVPWHAVVDALNHTKETHQDIAYIYFTGDLIDHGIWETTKEGNTESIVRSYNQIKETFPNIPVYPIIGNHEPHPLNVFAPSYITDEEFSTEWLYRMSADLWINYGWLPESTRQTILQGGFYTVSPRKGHRVIALNNNVCYTLNWWLVLEPQDPNGQLRWLADTLLEAEKNGEYVHILAHIPTGNKACYTVWSREYRKIVNRFAHVITAQFNGHTHFDEFNVYYDLEVPNRPVNVAWNGGSITPYSYLNPNYKVYTAEARTFGIVDIDTWMFNLTAANENPDKRPEWYKSYSFREEYGLRNLSVNSIHNWIVEASKDLTMVQQYLRNLYKHAEPLIRVPCDEQCLRDLLCAIVTTSADDNTLCGFLAS